MARRRRRSANVRSVARVAARAPRGRDTPIEAPAPLAALPPELRARYRQSVTAEARRLEAVYRRALKRRLYPGERAEIRKLARERASVIIRRSVLAVQRQASRDVAKFVTPGQSFPHARALAFGVRGQGGSGDTGLGGRLTRRIGRAGPRRLILRKPQWVDPYPQIPGTRPEKIIFAALVARRIFFIFQADWKDVDPENQAPVLYDVLFKPDFVLPQFRVVIDPFSEFHHSLPDAVQRDAEKRVLYFALGWKDYTPWASEVERKGGPAILDEMPELLRPPVAELSEQDRRAQLAQGYRLGPNLGLGAFSVGIANRKRRRPPTLRMR